MFRKITKALKDFVAQQHTNLNDIAPDLQVNKMEFSALNSLIRNQDIKHQEDIKAIELAKFQLEKEAHIRNLRLQHRLLIVTLLAVFVASLSAIVAIVIAVNQKTPEVMIQLDTNEQ